MAACRPGKSGVPAVSRAASSPSIMAGGSLRAASATAGNLFVQSSPLRVRRMGEGPSVFNWMRYPSILASLSQSLPDGGLDVLVHSCGRMKAGTSGGAGCVFAALRRGLAGLGIARVCRLGAAQRKESRKSWETADTCLRLPTASSHTSALLYAARPEKARAEEAPESDEALGTPLRAGGAAGIHCRA